jgi:hypothetical protein
VTVGKRGLATGTVEITTRETSDTVAVAVADAAAELRKLVATGAARQ